MEKFTTYEAFRAAYREAFASMMRYSLKEVGSAFFAQKMAAMAEAHPEWAARAEAEAE